MTQYLEERSGCEYNLEEEDIYESMSTVTAHDIFLKKTVIFDPQVKVGMESSCILIGIVFSFKLLSKRGNGINDALKSR